VMAPLHLLLLLHPKEEWPRKGVVGEYLGTTVQSRPSIILSVHHSPFTLGSPGRASSDRGSVAALGRETRVCWLGRWARACRSDRREGLWCSSGEPASTSLATTADLTNRLYFFSDKLLSQTCFYFSDLLITLFCFAGISTTLNVSLEFSALVPWRGLVHP
jgi:hypothetical protein